MYIGRILEKRPIPMKDFDTMAVVKVAQKELEQIQEPQRRRILENFIEHAEAEASGKYEALMASCSRKSQVYATHGSEFTAPQSYEELEQHYHGLIAMNLYLIHFEAEKLVVGDDAVVIEGLVHQLYPGNLLEPVFGVSIEDPDGVYMLTKRTLVTFVFDEDGKGAGEHAWTDSPTTADDFTRIAPDQVPAAFYANPLTA
ncbi:MAG: hypothetical protein JRG96_02195 [Deltaproteobacteria bacterium]|nr:hypothetical protein [Deltaproteobacteria bacterium]MBW2420587.1 hypothetical protein [Deltaproteobacteria bacterium]